MNTIIKYIFLLILYGTGVQSFVLANIGDARIDITLKEENRSQSTEYTRGIYLYRDWSYSIELSAGADIINLSGSNLESDGWSTAVPVSFKFMIGNKLQFGVQGAHHVYLAGWNYSSSSSGASRRIQLNHTRIGGALRYHFGQKTRFVYLQGGGGLMFGNLGETVNDTDEIIQSDLQNNVYLTGGLGYLVFTGNHFSFFADINYTHAITNESVQPGILAAGKFNIDSISVNMGIRLNL